MDCTRHDFIRDSAAFFVAAGLGGFAFGGDPAQAQLRVGILSDIHIALKDSDRSAYIGIDMFEKALRYFRDRKVDAVLVAGDLADNGIDSELLAIGDAWRRVFPQNRRPDGGMVEKVFVYGNHDIDGWSFMKGAKGLFKTDADRDRLAIGRGGNRGRVWREAFDEDYSPAYVKDVKGYKFVGVQYGEFDKAGVVGEFLEAHRAELAGNRPFFYTQHYHPRGTCSAPWVWGQDSGNSTAALKRFPNAVSFTGHSHTPLTDERTLWRGEFTSVGTASLKYLIPFGGRENSRIFGARDSKHQQMPALTCLDGHHGQVMTVFPDRIVLERRDFENDLPAAPDWVVPLPLAAATFAERSQKAPVPEFEAGAKVSVRQVDGRDRRGGKVRQVVVSFPNVRGLGGGARAFDFEVRVEAREVDREKTWIVKRVYSPHCYWSPERDDETVTCLFALSELPPPNGNLAPERGIEYRFAVSPADSFGRHGAAIYSDLQS